MCANSFVNLYCEA